MGSGWYVMGEQRHESLVFELEAWRQREFLKDDMKIQMVKMYEIQKERARFQSMPPDLLLRSILHSNSKTTRNEVFGTKLQY